MVAEKLVDPKAKLWDDGWSEWEGGAFYCANGPW